MIDLQKITPLALDANFNQEGVFIPFSDEIVVMQSTGLKDQEGKEIFEGDVLEWKAGQWCDACGIEPNEDRRKIVEWDAWAWNPFDFEGYDGIRPFECEKGEVIGNIYQHSDLLK